MKKILAVIATALALTLTDPPQSLAAETVSVEFFQQSLDPHGEWLEVGDYGHVWHPRDVGEDWRPYTEGSWAYTDAGWTWVSDEPFGSIVYHYGRWVSLEDTGWVWVPDTEWAPAWVSWRRSEQHVGWAPLPPEARFERTVGIKNWSDSYYDVGPTSYTFVEVKRFGSPKLRQAIIPVRENVTVIRETRNITNITVQNNYIYAGGPEYDVIVRESAEPVRRLRLERRTDVDFEPGRVRTGEYRTRIQGDTLAVFAPTVEIRQDIAPARGARRIESARVDRGWRDLGPQAETLRATLRKEAPQPPAELPPQPKFERRAAAATSTTGAARQPAAKPADAKNPASAPAATAPDAAVGADGTAAARPGAKVPATDAAKTGPAPDAKMPTADPAKTGAVPDATSTTEPRPGAPARRPRGEQPEPARKPPGDRPVPSGGETPPADASTAPKKPQGAPAPDAPEPPAARPGKGRPKMPDAAPATEPTTAPTEKPTRRGKPDAPTGADAPAPAGAGKTTPEASAPPSPNRERGKRPEGAARPDAPSAPDRPERPDRGERPDASAAPRTERPASPRSDAPAPDREKPDRVEAREAAPKPTQREAGAGAEAKPKPDAPAASTDAPAAGARGDAKKGKDKKEKPAE